MTTTTVASVNFTTPSDDGITTVLMTGRKIDFNSVSNKIEQWAKLGYWHYYLIDQSIVWSNHVFEIYDVDDSTPPAFESLVACFDPEFREEFIKFIENASINGIPYEFEKSITSFAGKRKTVRFFGEAQRDENADIVALFGVVKDITEDKTRALQLAESNQLLETASQIGKFGYWRLDLLNDHVQWSDETYRIHGYDPGEILPTLEFAIQRYHPDDRHLVESSVQRCINTGRDTSFRARVYDKNQQLKYVEAKGRCLREGNDKVALMGTFQDITEQLQLIEKNDWWRYLVNETIEGILITDPDGRVIWVNRAFERMTGYNEQEMLGKSPGQMLQGPETDPQVVRQLSDAMRRNEPVSAELLNYSKTGEPYWIFLSIFHRFDDDGNVIQRMAIEIDITERKQNEQALTAKQKELELLNFKLSRQKAAAEESLKREEQISKSLEIEIEKSKELQQQLRDMANTDVLTNIANRRCFLSRAESEFNRAKRYGHSLTFCSFDIDHFKGVNDSFGHQVGDQVIKNVAQLVRKMLRDGVDLVGRIGGEEFCAFLPETTIEDARVAFERIRSAIEEELIIDTRAITCSFGIASADSAESLNAVISQSDKFLYEAKTSGRNCVRG